MQTLILKVQRKHKYTKSILPFIQSSTSRLGSSTPSSVKATTQGDDATLEIKKIDKSSGPQLLQLGHTSRVMILTTLHLIAQSKILYHLLSRKQWKKSLVENIW